MKRLLCLLLVLCVIFSFALGCDNQKNQTAENEYVVTFLQEDGSKIVKIVSAGEDFDEFPQINPKDGYDAEWEVKDLSNIDSDLIVKAIYTPKTYVIYYDLGECTNATITAKTQEVKFDSEITTYISYLETIVDFDYMFVKWVVSGTNEEFMAKKYEFTEDLYLTAIWHKYTPDF